MSGPTIKTPFPGIGSIGSATAGGADATTTAQVTNPAIARDTGAADIFPPGKFARFSGSVCPGPNYRNRHRGQPAAGLIARRRRLRRMIVPSGAVALERLAALRDAGRGPATPVRRSCRGGRGGLATGIRPGPVDDQRQLLRRRWHGRPLSAATSWREGLHRRPVNSDACSPSGRPKRIPSTPAL
jgi:hypothetical protein